MATLGLRYFLPMALWADLRVDHKGEFKIAIDREEIPITQRLRVGGAVKYDFQEDWEYILNTYYILSKYTAFPLNYVRILFSGRLAIESVGFTLVIMNLKGIAKAKI